MKEMEETKKGRNERKEETKAKGLRAVQKRA